MNYYPSKYGDRWFTPPTVEPLDLDLSFLSGGGACPAQFEGETHDGRDVYCRYRGGVMKVRIAKRPDGSVFDEDADTVLTENIGPPLHGSINLGQFCRLAGITIDGVLPPLPSPEKMTQEGYYDLSGATTFYDVWVNSAVQTQRDFIEAVMDWSDATLMTRIYDDNYQTTGTRLCTSVTNIEAHDVIVVIGPVPDEQERLHFVDPMKPAPRGTVATLRISGFKAPMRPYSNPWIDRVREMTGIQIEVAGISETCLHDSFSLHARCKNDEDRNRIGRLDSLFDAMFPRYRIFTADIASGAPLPEQDETIQHHDPRIANWIGDEPSRWFGIRNAGDRDNPRIVGTRLERWTN